MGMVSQVVFVEYVKKTETRFFAKNVRGDILYSTPAETSPPNELGMGPVITSFVWQVRLIPLTNRPTWDSFAVMLAIVQHVAAPQLTRQRHLSTPLATGMFRPRPRPPASFALPFLVCRLIRHACVGSRLPERSEFRKEGPAGMNRITTKISPKMLYCICFHRLERSSRLMFYKLTVINCSNNKTCFTETPLSFKLYIHTYYYKEMRSYGLWIEVIQVNESSRPK